MDLSDIFGPEITPEIRALVKARIIKGGNLASRKDLSSDTIKLVLLVVHEVAPTIQITKAETAIIQGVGEKRLRRHRE